MMEKRINMNEIVKRIDRLPPIPNIVSLVLKAMDDPRSSVMDITRAMTGDEALVANVLKLANSAYYGFPRRIASVTEAIVILGLNTLRSLIYTYFSKGLLSKEVRGYSLGKGELWKHSISCAIICREIARKNRLGDIESYFIAGLLHDIGKIIIGEYLESEYETVIRRVTEENLPFDVIEKEVLGFSHPQIGGILAKRWNLPEFLVDGIRYHHEPENGTTLASSATHIADSITLMMGYGIGSDGLFYPISEELLKKFKLSGEENFESFISYVENLLTAAYQFFEI
jgi:putative nucleotidyltransferase with HDIG domain